MTSKLRLPDGVRVFHIRNRFGPCPGECFNRGGITIATKEVDTGYKKVIYAAIGVCGFKRSFDRKLGVRTAVGRLLRRLGPTTSKTPNGKFANSFRTDRFGNDSEFERALSLAYILVIDSSLKGKQRRTALGAIESTRRHYQFMLEIEDNKQKALERRQQKFDSCGSQTGRFPSDRPNKAHPGGMLPDAEG